MPSSITLTVSHLPTSTSFFLSALHPLDYAYRGRSGQTIGFGPSSSAAPPDFWITQEIPGVPAGAAHVAFPAASQRAVRDFFSAALKAGGKIHGEPAQRDANGYYSAAIIDFDGNSIEAVFRPGFGEEDKENNVRSIVQRRISSRAPTAVSRTLTSASRSLTTASGARSSGPAPAQRTSSPPKGDMLDNILGEARNTANVARNLVSQVRPQLHSTTSAPPAQSNDNKFGDAIVNTLLGVATGAALHYAFGSRKSEETSPPQSQRRPSVSDYGRSYTEPQQHEATSASQVSRDRYITMQVNDRDSTYGSTIGPASRTHSRSRESRRGSFDSGIGISPPSPSSRKSMKMLDAPPSAYKAISVMNDTIPHAGQSDTSRRSGRSSSTSRTITQRSRHRSSSASCDAKTVLYIKESLQRTATFPQPSDRRSTSSQSRHSHYSQTPERTPLPPSRTATWADSAAPKSAKSSAKSIVGLDRLSSEASQKKRDLTQSVVGKIKEQRRMDLPRCEVGPDDSVSQISSVRGSRRGR